MAPPVSTSFSQVFAKFGPEKSNAYPSLSPPGFSQATGAPSITAERFGRPFFVEAAQNAEASAIHTTHQALMRRNIDSWWTKKSKSQDDEGNGLQSLADHFGTLGELQRLAEAVSDSGIRRDSTATSYFVDDEDDEPSAPSGRIGVPDNFWDGNFLDFGPSTGRSRAQSRACSVFSVDSRSPRNRTESYLDFVYNKPQLESMDPTVGPAAAWQASWQPVSGNGVGQGVDHLTRITEAFELRREKPSPAVSSQSALESEDVVALKATKHEKQAKKDAQDELAKQMQKIQAGGAILQQQAEQKAKQQQEKDQKEKESKEKEQREKEQKEKLQQMQQQPLPQPQQPQQQQVVASVAQPGSNVSASSSASATVPAAAETSSPPKDPVSEHEDLVKMLDEKEDRLKAFNTDPSQKSFRINVKKQVNMKVSQIAANASSIQKCSEGLCAFLRENAQSSEIQREFLEVTLARRISEEAEVGIKATSTGAAAWPVARVAARIFEASPSVGNIFKAVMLKECVYLTPTHPWFKSALDVKSCGRRDQEDVDQFIKRMVAYVRLWFAVVVVQGTSKVVWQWLSMTLNLKPTPIVAPLLHAVLDFVMHPAAQRYRRQFAKLMEYIQMHYVAELEALGQSCSGEELAYLKASLPRLKLQLEEFRMGKMELPTGFQIAAREELELHPDA